MGPHYKRGAGEVAFRDSAARRFMAALGRTGIFRNFGNYAARLRRRPARILRGPDMEVGETEIQGWNALKRPAA